MSISRYGRISGVLSLCALGGFGLFAALVAAGQRGGETFFSNLWLSVPGLGGAACAIAGGVAAVLAMTREHDRGWRTISSTVLGAVVALWVTLEIVFPH
jgi:hypothetical protein